MPTELTRGDDEWGSKWMDGARYEFQLQGEEEKEKKGRKEGVKA